MKYKAEDYTYRVFWSAEDGEYVCVAEEFESLSNLGPTQAEAFAGMVDLLQSVLDDVYSQGNEPPEPSFPKREGVMRVQDIVASILEEKGQTKAQLARRRNTTSQNVNSWFTKSGQGTVENAIEMLEALDYKLVAIPSSGKGRKYTLKRTP